MIAERHLNSEYANDTYERISRYQKTAKNQANRLKSMKKMNNYVNSTLVQDEKEKHKLDVSQNKQDVTVDTIKKIGKKSRDAKLKLNLTDKSEKEIKAKPAKINYKEILVEENSKELNKGKHNKSVAKDVKAQKSDRSNKNDHISKKELSDIKNTKTGNRRKIETSVKL